MSAVWFVILLAKWKKLETFANLSFAQMEPVFMVLLGSSSLASYPYDMTHIFSIIHTKKVSVLLKNQSFLSCPMFFYHRTEPLLRAA